MSKSNPAPLRSFWIPLKERKPEPDQVVLVWWPNPPEDQNDEHCCFKARFCRHDKRTKGYFDTAEFEDAYLILANQEVTHWMPLPEGPVVNRFPSLKKKASLPMSKFDRDFVW